MFLSEEMPCILCGVIVMNEPEYIRHQSVEAFAASFSFV